MEKFYLEVPNIFRKEDARDFVLEFARESFILNESCSLKEYLDEKSYEDWLIMLEEQSHKDKNDDKVPTEVYFFVRESDEKIIGMISIRTGEKDKMRDFNGHVDYCIRPSERGKGYGKINLYLGLCKYLDMGVGEILARSLATDEVYNKTILSLGGKLIDTNSSLDNKDYNMYSIDVDAAIKNNSIKYEDSIIKEIR